MIRTVQPEDAAAICSIYNPYIQDTTITFEEEPVSEIEMTRRIREVTTTLPWLVLQDEAGVFGYAYATRWRVRTAYRFSSESAVYLDRRRTGAGHGTRLYSEFLMAVRNCGVHALMGGIALPNASSVALHEKLGFKKVAHFEQVGWKLDRWIDVGYWQIRL